MSRVQIDLPENFIFKTSIEIRIGDINYGGHVGNDKFLSIMHEARLQFLNKFGYSEMNIENQSLILADAAIEFKAELFYKDLVDIYVTADNFNKYGFDLYYLIQKQNAEETVVCKAKTAVLCFNYKTRKLSSLPIKVKETILS